jgi:cephalosporin hydroxylase
MMPPPMLQDDQEFAEFMQLIAELNVRSYLEVGAKFGGTLYRIGMSLPPGSPCVAVDMPSGTKVWPESERSLKSVASELTKSNHPCTIMWGDSTDPRVVQNVRELWDSYDLILIDANHTIDYVTKDFANYRRLARKAIAFHDISWKRGPDSTKTPIHVPQVWEQIKGDFRHREIRHDPSKVNNGIGVLLLE